MNISRAAALNRQFAYAMRFLVFTTLYPNAAMPNHGIFVENRLRAFLKAHDADVKVIAPTPWFPSSNALFGRYAKWSRAPLKETRYGIEVFHPRYLIPPKINMSYAPRALAGCFQKAATDLLQRGWDFDFIDAHYFYPDCIAAVKAAKALSKPVATTARGADINIISSYKAPQEKIISAALQADAIITVADTLKDKLVRLGAPAQKITTLRNGVDLDAFHMLDRNNIRKDMALSGLVIASVGQLIDRKGHDIIIKAIRDIPGATLLIAGEGSKRQALKKLAKGINVRHRVKFLGELPHKELIKVYNAADVLALASSSEGWPNVLLEAMACGTPCVATPMAGAEIIRAAPAGMIVDNRTPAAFANAIQNITEKPHDRTQTRRYAQAHSWKETVDGMAAIFSSLAQKNAAARSVTSSSLKPHMSDRPQLLVTVDTEEKFGWSSFQNVQHSICDPADVARFQDMCANEGVLPLYFLTYPLLKDQKTSAYFQRLLNAGSADGGLHLHQWTTAPETHFTGEYFSFQKNLPQPVYLNKLKALAQTFEATFEHRATAHRAGRYGVAPPDYELLAEIGIKIDFSPSVAFDFSQKGGPDFSSLANTPFQMTGKDWRVNVIPVSGLNAVRHSSFFLSRKNAQPGFTPPTRFAFQHWRQPMRLSPEGANLADLKALTHRLVADKAPILTFTLHSTSLTPGANSYAPDVESVEHLLSTSQQYLRWFREKLGGEIISLGALRQHFC